MNVRCIFLGAPRELCSNGESRRCGALKSLWPGKRLSLAKPSPTNASAKLLLFSDMAMGCPGCCAVCVPWLVRCSVGTPILWTISACTTHSMDYLRSHYHSTDAYESPSREFASNMSVKKYTFSKNVNYLHFTCILFSIYNLLIIRQLQRM